MQRVLDFAARYDMLPRYELLVAAVSGGMDSMCLLNFLYENGFRVVVAHYNHRLRGEEADMDEDLVRSWCAARRIPLCVGSGDVAAYARAHGLTVEEAARTLRYEFLNTVADDTRAVRILTAHHANDCAETVLFHLARGTGSAGLAGIPPVNGRLARPFLCLTREEIADYARAHRVPYREDASNSDTAYTRNLLRAEVLPQLTRVNPRAVAHIASAALRLREENDLLDSLAAERLAMLKRNAKSVSFPVSAVGAAPNALQARVLRLALDSLGAGRKDFTAEHYDALCALCDVTAPKSAQLDLPHGVRARRARGTLTLTRGVTPPPTPVALHAGETAAWGSYRISCRKIEKIAEIGEKTVENSENIVIVRDGALTVGAWQPDDRLTLPDARGARSLKRIFSERGVPPCERDTVPTVRVDGALAAVRGIGTDAAFVPHAGDAALALEFHAAEKPRHET